MAEIQDYLGEMGQYLAPAKGEVESTGKNYAYATGEAPSLPFKLQEALQKKLDYNQDLIKQQSGFEADYFAAPSEAREKYQDVWNPFEREKLVAQARTQAYEPYATATGVLDQRMGQVADIVNAGAAGWQGMVQHAGALAELAQTKLENVFREYQQAAGMKAAADQLKQYEDEQAFKREQWEWEKPWQEKIWGQQLAKGTGSGSGSYTYGTDSVEDKAVDSWTQWYAQKLNTEPPEWSAINEVPSKYRDAVLGKTDMATKSEQATEEDQGWAISDLVNKAKNIPNPLPPSIWEKIKEWDPAWQLSGSLFNNPHAKK